MNESQKRYPTDWELLSFVKKLTAFGRCERCHTPHSPATHQSLNVHHIDSDSSNNSPANLICLCQRCHLSVHATLKLYELADLYFIDPYPEWLKPYLPIQKGL